MNGSDNEEIGDFPYVWLNKTDLVEKPNDVDKVEDCKVWTQFLHLSPLNEAEGEESPRLKNVFALSYLSLLEAIAARDLRHLNLVCEGNLYRAFNEGFED